MSVPVPVTCAAAAVAASNASIAARHMEEEKKKELEYKNSLTTEERLEYVKSKKEENKEDKKVFSKLAIISCSVLAAVIVYYVITGFSLIDELSTWYDITILALGALSLSSAIACGIATLEAYSDYIDNDQEIEYIEKQLLKEKEKKIKKELKESKEKSYDNPLTESEDKEKLSELERCKQLRDLLIEKYKLAKTIEEKKEIYEQYKENYLKMSEFSSEEDEVKLTLK